MRILHVTYHLGCKKSIDYVCKSLGHELETQEASWNYNMSQLRADQIWQSNKDYYNSFDCIITSDTAPLSRIFLREEFEKKLIIWVCNRFDYSDASTNDCNFPDPHFYDLFRKASFRPNTFIRSYTKFEHEYAKKHKNVEWDGEVFKPVVEIDSSEMGEFFPEGQKKSETFLITRYHNDNILLDLKEICDSLGIPNYRGIYRGPEDLNGIRGIIHIPYAWSNLALFENWSIGNVYLIPSLSFLRELSKDGKFFWSPPLDWDLIHSSEWYLPEHNDLFIYFNSFQHLKEVAMDQEKIKETKQKIKEFMRDHNLKIINRWDKILNQ